MEIIAEFEPGTSSKFGVKVRTSKDGKTGTKIYFNVKSGEIGIKGNLKISSPYPEIGHATAYFKPVETVKMHLFLNHSLLEVFVNGQAGSDVITSNPADLGIDLFKENGEAALTSPDVWEMKSIWVA